MGGGHLSFKLPQWRVIVDEIMFGEIEKEVVVLVLDSVAIFKMLVNSSAGFCDGVFDFVMPFELHEKDENLEIFAEISRKQVPKSKVTSDSSFMSA